VRLFQLTYDATKGMKAELNAEFNQHLSEVWKVDWNVTGTILASSGDDGKVFLWKANYMDEWSQLATFQPDSSNARKV
jgi:nucleoporin SEH1